MTVSLWDGLPVPPDRWGADHAAVLALLAAAPGGRLDWGRLRGHRGTGKQRETRLAGRDGISGHDDVDCVVDVVAAGYATPCYVAALDHNPGGRSAARLAAVVAHLRGGDPAFVLLASGALRAWVTALAPRHRSPLVWWVAVEGRRRRSA